jgi:hypothetical protein
MAHGEEAVFVPYSSVELWIFSAVRLSELTGASCENGIPGGVKSFAALTTCDRAIKAASSTGRAVAKYS